MIKLRHIAALLALAGASAMLPAHAQSTASALASGTIKVTRPISVTKNLDMAFGTIVKGAGTVTIANDGTRTAGGATTALASTSASQAQFTISGEGGQSISVQVPANFTMSNSTTGNGTLTVTTTHDMQGSVGAQTLSGALGDASNGSLVVNVGGSVPLLANTPTGVYTGSFTVTADYN